MKYVSLTANEEEESKANESSLTQEGKHKPKKAAKPAKIAKEEVPPDGPPGSSGPPQITGAQSVSLRKVLDILIGTHNDLAANMEVIDKGNLRDHVVAAT